MAKVAPPPGIFPIYIRGVTAEKYGFKTGDNVMDLVDYKWVNKEEIMKEIIGMGVMSDFEPARKPIESAPGDEIFFIIDKKQEYGEIFLIAYTAEAQETFLSKIREEENAIAAQKAEEEAIAAAAAAAHAARLTIEYEDKPITPRMWESATSADTEAEIADLGGIELKRDLIAIEVTRPKKHTKLPVRFYDSEVNVVDIKSTKDPNFKAIREIHAGFQSAPSYSTSASQTAWFRRVNKSCQYEAVGVAVPEKKTSSTSTGTGTMTSSGAGSDSPIQEVSLLQQISQNAELKEGLCEFLEKATSKIEYSLQQNETVDIFMETFQTNEGDEVRDDHTDSNMRELKNFGDPMYSKTKCLPAIDWMPRVQGMVAVSAVRNITFEQRVAVMGQTYSAYVLLWDFKHLVRPQVLMQSETEVFSFRFNKKQNNIIAGGTISGQVVLWDIAEAMELIASRTRRSAGGSGASAAATMEEGGEDEESVSTPIVTPKYVSSIDYCHKRAVTEIFWLPPSMQINYRGHIVSDDYLDGNSYQFISVSTDGLVMVWDTRYEQIAADEVKHIGRAKHVPMEKVSIKDTDKEKEKEKSPSNGTKGSTSTSTADEEPVAAAAASAAAAAAGEPAEKEKSNQHFKPIWTPIYKAHLKKQDGVGEISICKVAYTGAMNTALINPPAPPVKAGEKALPPPAVDPRSQLLLSTEEGDLLMADICATKGTENRARGDENDEDEGGESGRDFVKWLMKDHSRPSVALQVSPFFPDIALSVCDWGFHLWKIGSDVPLFSSPVSSICFTGGAWSPTRPAVLFVAAADGHLFVWDFTDSSYRPSSELHITHYSITSMEFLVNESAASANKQQLMAIGDESGTLHIFEIPRNLSRPVHKEENGMKDFLDREYQCLQYNQKSLESAREDAAAGEHMMVQAQVPTAVAIPPAEQKALEVELLKKDDDDFAALEAKFIAELEINKQQ